jgi:hypothetical protein
LLTRIQTIGANAVAVRAETLVTPVPGSGSVPPRIAAAAKRQRYVIHTLVSGTDGARVLGIVAAAIGEQPPRVPDPDFLHVIARSLFSVTEVEPKTTLLERTA